MIHMENITMKKRSMIVELEVEDTDDTLEALFIDGDDRDLIPFVRGYFHRLFKPELPYKTKLVSVKSR